MKRERKFTSNSKIIVLINIILAVLVILMVVLFYEKNVILTLILVFLSFVVIFFRFGKKDIYFYIVAAILGSIGEIVAVSYGAWSYANPSFLGIPMWLPILWGLAIVAIRNITLETIEVQKGGKK